MMGHKIGFNGKIWILSPVPLFICSTENDGKHDHLTSLQDIETIIFPEYLVVVVDVVLFNVHGKHLWSCRDGQLT